MRALKALGFNPPRILDIGAYRGAWSEVMWHVWPRARFHLIEANEECVPYLAQTGFTHDIALLSDKIENAVYHKCQTGSGEGNGLYRESSVHPFVETVKTTMTLDALLPDHVFDLVKLDCQGAESKVIAGGLNLIGRATLVQLECQIQPYNVGAPTATQTIAYMDSLGFRLYDIVESHLNSRQMLIQADFLFARKDSGLFDLKVLS